MAKPATTTLSIKPMDTRQIEVNLIGQGGMYMNSMSAKAMRDLLLGGKKKTAAERASTLKHNPRTEFASSAYYAAKDAPTMLGFPASGFKAAMAQAALVTDGIKKSDVQKLLYVVGDIAPIWGVPFLRMDVVRNSDINRTPDVRTRAFLPEFATTLTLRYTAPNFTQQSAVNLLVNAGIVCGIGDFRQEKGKGNFGLFRVVAADDPDLIRIKAEGDRAAQEAAMDAQTPYDQTTAELLDYFDSEVQARELVV